MTLAGKSPDESAFLSQLGLRVRRARAKAGLTRRALTLRSGVSERYLAQLESGTGNISILLIRRVAAALGVELLELIGPPIDLGRRGRIALTGMRGAGKSTLGARLAAALDVPFFELSEETRREADEAPPGDAAPDAQQARRAAERRALARVLEANERCVVAATGALVVDPQAWQLLRSRCLTVWLRAAPEDHAQRVAAQAEPRPAALREQGLDELRAVFAEREGLYQQADAVVDTGGVDETRSLADLLAAVRELGADMPPQGWLAPSSGASVNRP